MDLESRPASLPPVKSSVTSLVDEGKLSTASQMPLADALRYISSQTAFAAVDVEGICGLNIRRYSPLVCTTLHAGSVFPTELEKFCLLSPSQRRFEEDPHTQKLLESLPITLNGLESRYYYDLNRSPGQATDSYVFGHETWEKGEHPAQFRALARHQHFYQLAGALIKELIESYGFCIVLDLHSYNGSRIDRETPLFNLGTAEIEIGDYRDLLDELLRGLARIELPGIHAGVAENDVFQGRGYFVNWIRRSFPAALPLCLEVKKIYCHERSGQIDANVFPALQKGLGQVIHRLHDRCCDSWHQTVN